MRLLQYFLIYRNQIVGIKVKPSEPQIDLVKANDCLLFQEAEVHIAEGRSIADQHHTFTTVAVLEEPAPSDVHQCPIAI
jgi:hypothetical protein